MDDRNFTPPRGYRADKPRYRLIRSLQLRNTSKKIIRSPRLRINGRPLNAIGSIVPLDAELTQREKALRLYRFWTRNILHFPVGMKACRHPFILVNFWGYNICGFAAAFLSSILQNMGIEARKLPVQGHVVHQYKVDGRWVILDADLNCAFRTLDNRRLAGFEDICGDPLLVHRTNTYGRHRTFDLARNRFCASLYDRKPSGVAKTPSYNCEEFKKLTDPRRMFPGESITYRFDQTVIEPLREKGSPHPREVGEASLMQVHYLFKPLLRPSGNRGEKHLFTRYPIRRIIFQTSGREIKIPVDQIVTNISIPNDLPEDVLCICQCSRISAHPIMKGANAIRLNSPDGDIEAELEITWDEKTAELEPIPIPVLSIEKTYEDRPVCFQVMPGVYWIQVFGEDELPLLDYVREVTGEIAFDPLEQTFFDNDRSYRARIKQEVEGIWSEWSEYLPFSVIKPNSPHDIEIRLDDHGEIVFTWQGEDDCEYLIFGSNRLDFVPDVYSDQQPTGGLDGHLKMENIQNLIIRTQGTEARVDRPCVYYRMIAMRNGCLSNPSRLIDLSQNQEWCTRFKLIPTVLNTRHEMVNESNRYRSEVESLHR